MAVGKFRFLLVLELRPSAPGWLLAGDRSLSLAVDLLETKSKQVRGRERVRMREKSV